MAYREKYISKEEYDNAYVNRNLLYEGFVIGHGYAYASAVVFQPSHWNGYCPDNNDYVGASFSTMGKAQLFDDSKEAVKLSFRGLFMHGVATIIVEKNMTLSSIAEMFDVSVNDLANWNGIKNRNLIYAGQQLKIYKNRTPGYIFDDDKKISSIVRDTDAGRNTDDNKPIAVKSPSFSDKITSATLSQTIANEFEIKIMKLNYSYKTTQGNSKLFNTDLNTVFTNGAASVVMTQGVDIKILKADLSVKNGIISSASAEIPGPFSSIGVSVDFESFMDITFNAHASLNYKNKSHSVSAGVKPVRVAYGLVCVGALFVLKRLVPATPGMNLQLAPSVVPVMPQEMF